jgi:hypothetical protein
MQKETTFVIVLASVLKSVTDVRMYKKLALSLNEKVGNSEIHIIGSATNFENHHNNNDFKNEAFIKFYPIAIFHRLAYQRLFFGFIFLKLLYKIKPKLLIINTFELLPFAIFFKLSNYFQTKKQKNSRVKLVYDVMENYFQNIAYQTTYPKILRFPLAFAVRIIENLCSIFVDNFILAEKCYETELEFVGKNYVILENKYLASPKEKPVVADFSPQKMDFFGLKSEATDIMTKSKTQLTFIYTGTISCSYGTLEAILFIKNLLKRHFNIRLIIIGFCSDKIYYAELLAACENFTNIIDWQVSIDKPVAHEKILTAMKNADIALLPYQINKSNKNRIPTKFYEYIYHKIPMIISENEVWEFFCQQYDCAISYNFEELKSEKSETEKTLKELLETNFYQIQFDENEILWTENDKQKLQQIL